MDGDWVGLGKIEIEWSWAGLGLSDVVVGLG